MSNKPDGKATAVNAKPASAEETIDKYMEFKLNDAKISFMDFVSADIGSGQKSKEVTDLKRTRSALSVLLPFYRNHREKAKSKLAVLKARLYEKIKVDMVQGGERVTEAALENAIVQNPEYQALNDRFMYLNAKADFLYHLLELAKDRRDDLKFIYGSGAMPE